MTPTGARATAAKTAKRAGLEAGAVPGPTRPRPRSPGAPVPRRVSGPAVPRQLPGRRARPAPDRRQSRSARLSAFVASLPDHPLLDRLIRGRAWIPLLGVMLAGIVAMQVELLKLNAATGRSIELIGSVQGRNEILRAQVASASDPARIERLAGRMGMTMPGPGTITFLSARSASVRRAVAGIQAPNVAAFQAALQALQASTAGMSLLTTPSTTPTTASKRPKSTTGATSPTGPQARTTSGATGATSPTGPQATTTGAPPATVP